MLEHPIITNLERSGYPDGKAHPAPVCPICGEETDTLYKDRGGDVFGCGECVRICDAWEI